jgi:hypothetical protein
MEVKTMSKKRKYYTPEEKISILRKAMEKWNVGMDPYVGNASGLVFP